MQPAKLLVLQAILMRVKRPGRDADLSRPVVEVKEAWNYISVLPYIFVTCCYIRHTDNFNQCLIVRHHRSSKWRLSFEASFLLSPSIGLCYIARGACSDTVYTHQFYQVVYWVGSESVVSDRFWNNTKGSQKIRFPILLPPNNFI
jgi:hypothetical protein